MMKEVDVVSKDEIKEYVDELLSFRGIKRGEDLDIHSLVKQFDLIVHEDKSLDSTEEGVLSISPDGMYKYIDVGYFLPDKTQKVAIAYLFSCYLLYYLRPGLGGRYTCHINDNYSYDENAGFCMDYLFGRDY